MPTIFHSVVIAAWYSVERHCQRWKSEYELSLVALLKVSIVTDPPCLLILQLGAAALRGQSSLARCWRKQVQLQRPCATVQWQINWSNWADVIWKTLAAVGYREFSRKVSWLLDQEKATGTNCKSKTQENDEIWFTRGWVVGQVFGTNAWSSVGEHMAVLKGEVGLQLLRLVWDTVRPGSS